MRRHRAFTLSELLVVIAIIAVLIALLLPASQAARSNQPGGANFLFCDGHVVFIKNTVSVPTWRALATRALGEVISSDSY